MLEHQNLKCLLVSAMQDDSIDGIYDTLKQTAKISQSAGGGLSIQMFVQQVLTFVEQMEHQMVLFLC
jgi:hypothetical protein